MGGFGSEKGKDFPCEENINWDLEVKVTASFQRRKWSINRVTSRLEVDAMIENRTIRILLLHLLGCCTY